VTARASQVALVGTTFRQVGFEGLGPLTFGSDDHARRAELRGALGASELVYLATCNRVECYVAGPTLDAAELRRLAHRAFGAVAEELWTVKVGHAAVEHLFGVASSLDSFVVGETDVVRQLRAARDLSMAHHLAGPILERVFERAARCAARVHTETQLNATPVSVATLAVHKIQRHFGQTGPPKSVLVGTGDMTRKVAGALSRGPGDLLFVNRSLEGAQKLAARFGGRAQSLEAFCADPPAEIDLVFSATSAPNPIIPAQALEPAMSARRGQAPLIVCDLGVPRDVDPSLEGREGILLIALEHLEVLASLNRARLEGELESARAIVSEQAQRLAREDRFRNLADHSTQAILEGRLAHLSAADRQAILRFATGLAERIARQPE
jgi:glutamyl-tRNA reductase